MTLPPLGIVITAVVFAYSGGQSLAGIVHALARGRIEIDLGVLYLALATGLLMGKPTARRWALGIAIVVALMVVVGIGVFAWQASGPLSLGSVFSFQTAQLVTWILAVTGGIAALSTAAGRNWFLVHDTARLPHRLWVLPCAALGLLAYVGEHAAARDYEKRLEQVFQINTRFVFTDASTGELVDQMGTGGIALVGDKRDPFRARLSFSTMRANERWDPYITGVAFAPHTMTFHKEGYRDVTYEFTRSSPGTVEIKVEPAP